MKRMQDRLVNRLHLLSIIAASFKRCIQLSVLSPQSSISILIRTNYLWHLKFNNLFWISSSFSCYQVFSNSTGLSNIVVSLPLMNLKITFYSLSHFFLKSLNSLVTDKWENYSYTHFRNEVYETYSVCLKKSFSLSSWGKNIQNV